MPLSDRVPPEFKAEVELLEKFYDLAIKERDLARQSVAWLEAENRKLKLAVGPTAEAVTVGHRSDAERLADVMGLFRG